MSTIAIIGAGNIGTRHLQGMYGVKERSNIYVYDLSEASLEQCKKICSESDVTKNHDITYISDLNDMPKSLDVVVVATSANVRRKVVEELVANFDIKNFILEKVLFQKVEDYHFVAELLERKGIKAWVNCPKRLYPSYGALKDKLKDVECFEIDIFGNNWGMGCNTIHFIDLISFLADDKELNITNAKFDDEVVESKRKGFFELNGVIEGNIGKCEKFRITSYPDSVDSIPLTISIHSPYKNYVIVEGKKEIVEYSKENGWVMEKNDFEVLYQSQLAYIPVNDILEKGECGLATYSRSMAEHLPVIETFIDKHFSKLGIGDKTCPIT